MTSCTTSSPSTTVSKGLILAGLTPEPVVDAVRGSGLDGARRRRPSRPDRGGRAASRSAILSANGPPVDQPLDEAVDARVRADDTPAGRSVRAVASGPASLGGGSCDADPDVIVRWAAAPLKPRTLATTRLAEHWAHGLDICDPLGLPLEDTDRLRHVAWLGHATLPYSMRLAGLDPVEVRCTLVAPERCALDVRPATAAAWIRGSAGAFCRVGARRLAAGRFRARSVGTGRGRSAAVLRNYAA